MRDCEGGEDEADCDDSDENEAVQRFAEDYDLTRKGSKENMVAVLRFVFDESRYSKRVRPVEQEADVMAVDVNMQMVTMFKIDESDQTMRSMIQVLLSAFVNTFSSYHD